MNTQSWMSHKPSLKVIVIAIVLIAGAAYFFTRASAGSAKGGPGFPTPMVSAATAQRGDIDVSLDALGTVTPLHTVTITARVQGQIMKVNYAEGQMVKKGDPLIQIDPRPYEAALAQAKGQLVKDEATLKADKIDLQRYQTAFEGEAISKQQVDDQAQLVKQYEGAVITDKGALESAQANLDYCYIKAPISGRLGLRLVDEGNMIQTGSTTPLVVITQLQPITVIFNLAEDDISKIQGQLVDKNAMAVETYDRSQSKKIADGAFGSLDNQVDPTTGTIKARADYPNTDLALFPNEFVNVKVRVKTEHNLVRIPTVAIQKGSQGAFVYLISDDNIIHVQSIEAGIADATYTSVTGLHENDRVATSNFDKLQEKTRVQIRPEEDAAPANKAVSKKETTGESVAKEDAK